MREETARWLGPLDDGICAKPAVANWPQATQSLGQFLASYVERPKADAQAAHLSKEAAQQSADKVCEAEEKTGTESAGKC